MGFKATTTKTITEGIGKTDAKLFIRHVQLNWNGQPNEFKDAIAGALSSIGVQNFSLTENVANGVATKLERKSGMEL